MVKLKDIKAKLKWMVQKYFLRTFIGWFVIAMIWAFVLPEEMLRSIGFYFIGMVVMPFGLYLGLSHTRTLKFRSANEKKRRIGEAFTHAVKLLGDEKAAVRQGGIYVLGALANEEKEQYETIIKIIASYIRETRNIKKNIKSDIKQGDMDFNEVDIEAALSVIKNRYYKWDKKPSDTERFVFDLSNAFLTNGDLSNMELSNINMSDITAEGCIFKRTNFSNSNMRAAKFTKECNFKYTKLDDTELYDADLSGVSNLTQEQIERAKGNKETKLPHGITRPKHWG